MKDPTTFNETMIKGYHCDGAAITLGAAKYDKQVFPDATITVALKSLNRHGLIAGATGTGKTKTIQLLAEKLSLQGVPSLLMDLKGDLSGLAAAGTSNATLIARQTQLDVPYTPMSFPVEFLSLSKEPGIKLRATVSEFGPLLFAKILELNDIQAGIVSLIFKYCDDNHLPLLDLKDFKKSLHFSTNEGKAEFEKLYGRISSASASTILRKIIEIEQQGGECFFGEPSFDVEDLLHFDEQGRGTISILRLIDLQNRPKLFSSFMLCLLAELYTKFPEKGDLEQPKLVIFIDEAHLLFKQATKELLAQIESIIKLIRSKGVGVFFCTQNPTDIPDSVLSQLGMKVQHALRAFTAKDRKAIKLIAENYPSSPYYKTDELLTSLGIGEAAITTLNEKGRPTPLAATLLNAPQSRMGPLTQSELTEIVKQSRLTSKYNQAIDRESAYEILVEKLATIEKQQASTTKATKAGKPRSKNAETFLTKLSKNTMVRQIGRTIARELSRGLLGILKKS